LTRTVILTAVTLPGGGGGELVHAVQEQLRVGGEARAVGQPVVGAMELQRGGVDEVQQAHARRVHRVRRRQ